MVASRSATVYQNNRCSFSVNFTIHLYAFTGAYPLSCCTCRVSLFAGIELSFEFVHLVIINADSISNLTFFVLLSFMRLITRFCRKVSEYYRMRVRSLSRKSVYAEVNGAKLYKKQQEKVSCYM